MKTRSLAKLLDSPLNSHPLSVRRQEDIRSMSESSVVDASNTKSGSATVFTPISAPIIRSVDPVKVARFLKERERYEIEISAILFRTRQNEWGPRWPSGSVALSLQ